MRNTKNAFTLVELIVVITILAILGTIAFISLQGYSADARNSKRTSDLSSIQKALSVKVVEGVPLMSFVTPTTSAVITDINLAGVALTTATSTDYAAGKPAYTVLNIVEKDFKDPQGNPYVIGATKLSGGTFQLAATIEVDGIDEALVNGTFNSRGTDTYTGAIVSDVFTLVDESANSMKKGDTVTVSLDGTPVVGSFTIEKVARDGVTITLSSAPGSVNQIELTLAEDTGLIAATKDSNGAITPTNTAAVISGSGDTLAY